MEDNSCSNFMSLSQSTVNSNNPPVNGNRYSLSPLILISIFSWRLPAEWEMKIAPTIFQTHLAYIHVKSTFYSTFVVGIARKPDLFPPISYFVFSNEKISFHEITASLSTFQLICSAMSSSWNFLRLAKNNSGLFVLHKLRACWRMKLSAARKRLNSNLLRNLINL